MRTEEELLQILRRCPPEALAAALAYHQRRDEAQALRVVLGVLERFAQPERREQVRGAGDTTRLVEDLGFDSFALLECVMVVEDALEVSLSTEDLAQLATLGDLQRLLKRKAAHGT